jgi:hypothetical protein
VLVRQVRSLRYELSDCVLYCYFKIGIDQIFEMIGGSTTYAELLRQVRSLRYELSDCVLYCYFKIGG